MTAIAGGSLLAVAGFLLHNHHHTLAAGIVGFASVFAVLEGAHRVWSPLDKELQDAKGRLEEVDSRL